MITVVEEPSAVGKTTLLRQLPSHLVVSEDWAALGFPQETWPNLRTPQGQAFGVTLTAHRWQLLCEAEANYGIAYADTDPLNFTTISLLCFTAPSHASNYFSLSARIVKQ